MDIARGAALECAEIQDVLVTMKGMNVQDDAAMKAMLHRIVAMLTQMAMKFDGVAESNAVYDADVDYDYEHRWLSTSTSTSISTKPKTRRNHGMRRSGGGVADRLSIDSLVFSHRIARTLAGVNRSAGDQWLR